MNTATKRSSTRKPVTVVKKKFTRFRPSVFTRHPSHDVLRINLPLLPFKSVVRLGSTTDAKDSVTNGGQRVECNTIEAIENSANKGLMKDCFAEAGVITADWWRWSHGTNFSGPDGDNTIAELSYPIIAKHVNGSRGTGNYKLDTIEALTTWMRGKELDNYIFEKFYNFNREYRLHITSEGCFYTCRKLLKEETPEANRWYRNDSNCTWIVENNASFDKPVNWDAIVAESVKALNAVGLDIGCMDVKIQSTRDSRNRIRENPEFIILECNSAPSFGTITAQKYTEELPKLLKRKYAANRD